jgi:hypothetical protein
VTTLGYTSLNPHMASFPGTCTNFLFCTLRRILTPAYHLACIPYFILLYLSASMRSTFCVYVGDVVYIANRTLAFGHSFTMFSYLSRTNYCADSVMSVA